MANVDGLIKQLMVLASSDKPKVMVPAIRALGNSLTGNDENTETIMNSGFLDMAAYMLNGSMRRADSVIKDVIWGLSNIAAGTPKQQHRLASRTDLLREVSDRLKGAEFKIRKVNLNIRISSQYAFRNAVMFSEILLQAQRS